MEGYQVPAASGPASGRADGLQGEFARGVRRLQAALVLYVLEVIVGVATLGYTPFVHLVWSLAPMGPWLVLVLLAANGILLGLAGLGLWHMERASRQLEPAWERALLRSRLAFLFALAVCLGQIPTWLVVLMDPVGGMYPPKVTTALSWGGVLLLAGLAVAVADALRRRELVPFPGGRKTTALVAVLLVAVTVPVPVLSLMTNMGWSQAAFAAPVDSPGLRVSAVLGGAEASLLLLLALWVPVAALGPDVGRRHARRGWLAGLAAIVMEVALAAVLRPPLIAPWFTAPFEGLPPVAWGAPAAVLVAFSVHELGLAYGSIGREPAAPPVRLPTSERPAWWAPYVDPVSGLRRDALSLGSDLFVATLVLFVVLVVSSLAGFGLRFLSGPALPVVGLLSMVLGPLGWLALLAPIPLAILFGLALSAIHRAVRSAAPRIQRQVLLARASFWIGISLVFELLPVFLASVVGSRYGPRKEDILTASWWGLALLLPFLLGAVLPSEWLVLKREPREGRGWAAFYLAAWVPLALAVPLAAIAITSAWEPPAGLIYNPTPPGTYVISMGAGIEAALALFLAVTLPVSTLAPAGQRATAETLVEHCRDRIAGYKKPKSVEFVDALPKGSTGKVLKRELRRAYWSAEARQVH